MTIPANLNLEAGPYGPQPVLPVAGPQGGPYSVNTPTGEELLPSVPRTATTASNTAIPGPWRGALFFFSVTVNPGGAQTLTFEVLARNPFTTGWTPILTAAASATPGGLFAIYPGLSGAAVEGVGVTRNLPLPSQFLVRVTHSGVGAWTYEVWCEKLP